jgi:ELWxxDGT repeat protein
MTVLLLLVALAACSGGGAGGGGGGGATPTFTIGGSVSGLSGTVVLRNNGSDDLSLSANGPFAFATSLADGASYGVTVLTQPAGQTCLVSNGTGAVSGANVSNVTVSCATNTYTVGGAVSGLIGTVVLRNNGSDDLSLSANGPFVFATALADGASYGVTALTQPAGQTCLVTNGTGAVSGANVSNVTVSCTTNTYTVGGAVSGLIGTVVLQNNGSDDLSRSANGPFVFSTALTDGSGYAVSVFSQPIGQCCSVANGTGTLAGANVTNVAVTCTALYFSADDGASGEELWKTDGTAAGTFRVKDISPGAGASQPFGMTAFNGALYFAASDGVSGSELWKTDGTEAGTVRVKDISPGVNPSAPDGFTVFNGALYFRAFEPVAGGELWKTDGTESGTVRVKDINPGVEASLPLFPAFAVLNGAMYFAGREAATGFELWKTDGTEAGTVRVKDINPGASGSFDPFRRGLIAFNGAVYFAADDGVSGFELWKSDGTDAGTARVKDISPGASSSSPIGFAVFNSALYFQADDGASGLELWKSDGTEAGTVRVKDINPGASGSVPSGFAVSNGVLYFIADDGVSGAELWKSDGTEAGTVRVKDINAGANPSFSFLAPGSIAFNGALYFAADDGVSGVGLWKSDGTEAGTVRVSTVGPGFLGGPLLTVFDGALYFAGNDGVSGTELWKSDGTGPGTVRVKDINPAAPTFPPLGSSLPNGLTPF